ncbi:hypothetical protein NQ318_009023 [Aromia moschata]|uniref:DUF4817 domain-containing protein n=1 Tax=Aromia moschata TaxID=1265417 RepID=A0AAV8YWL3_9CUCU|nr:hypothetical protein NQ318_009023 [Aromia moschata]
MHVRPFPSRSGTLLPTGTGGTTVAVKISGYAFYRKSLLRTRTLFSFGLSAGQLKKERELNAKLFACFGETHPDLPPLNQGTISKIEAQYREMGHVRKVPSKRQAVVDDDTKLNLLLALEENPITPARQLARDSNLNHKTVLKNT